MINPIVDRPYVIHHNGVNKTMIFIGLIEREKTSYSRASTHYLFKNLRTSREVVIKSRVKIRREIVAGGLDND